MNRLLTFVLILVPFILFSQDDEFLNYEFQRDINNKCFIEKIIDIPDTGQKEILYLLKSGLNELGIDDDRFDVLDQKKIFIDNILYKNQRCSIKVYSKENKARILISEIESYSSTISQRIELTLKYLYKGNGKVRTRNLEAKKNHIVLCNEIIQIIENALLKSDDSNW